MTSMSFIITSILFPIFIQIVVGFLLQKRLKLNIRSLSRVQIYAFIPALIFIKFYTSSLGGTYILQISGFTILLFFILMLISAGVGKVLKLPKKKRKAFENAVILRNQANYGIPLITLLYLESGAELALSIHMVVLLNTNVLLNTVGLYNASSGTYTSKEALSKILRMPMIYTIGLGIIFKYMHITLPESIMTTLTIMGNGVVPLALFTMGAQLAETKFDFKDYTISIAAVMRLILSPLLAFAMVYVFGIQGTMAQVLIIGASAPTAVNSVMLSIEFEGDAAYASQAVLLTTLLSFITVTGTIMLVM